MNPNPPEVAEPSTALPMNSVALRTLIRKEVRRFSKVWLQTVLSPIVTTSLYFLVFGVALGSRLKTIQGTPYIEYVVPGLIMLALINNAFLNSSSSLFQSKINRTIVDLLVAPIGATEIILAYVIGAVLRATMVATLIYAVAFIFTGLTVAHPGWTLLFALTVSASFGVMGLIAALWAENFDRLSILPNFLLSPLTFLGGVFYSVEMLPEPWNQISKLNPILYMVNGLRYGMLGKSDIDPKIAAALCIALLTTMTIICATLIRKGYKLRS